MRAVVLILVLLVTGCLQKDPYLGRWKGVDKQGKEVRIVLSEDKQFTAIANGETVVGTWSLNREVDPNQLDLTFEGKTVHLLVAIQGDTLKIEQIPADKPAPSTLSSNAISYHRHQ